MNQFENYEVRLHFNTFGEGDPLIIMHGVFGSSDNWQTLGKVFAQHFKVYLVDLRNHGNSPHSDKFDYDVMVADVIELMSDEHIEKTHVLGHSMGGKVAMHLATKHAFKVEKLIVIDIAPKYYSPHHKQIFEGFHSVKLATLSSRKDADDQLSKVIADLDVRQFILKNLTRTPDGHFEWKLNINAVEKASKKLGEGLEQSVSYNGPTLFIAGSKSRYIQPEDHQLIQLLFPNSILNTIEGVGHWVHAEEPQELGKMVLKFLS